MGMTTIVLIRKENNELVASAGQVSMCNKVIKSNEERGGRGRGWEI